MGWNYTNSYTSLLFSNVSDKNIKNSAIWSTLYNDVLVLIKRLPQTAKHLGIPVPPYPDEISDVNSELQRANDDQGR